MTNSTSTSTSSSICNGCGKQVSGGTYISNVFYCPMCASVINKNNRASVIIDNVHIKGMEDSKLFDFAKQMQDTFDRGSNSNACDNCSKNPKNGGDGICHCILGSMNITC